jgi:hypothetical protein
MLLVYFLRHSAVCEYLSVTSGLYIIIITYAVTFSKPLVIIIRVTINLRIFLYTFCLWCLVACAERNKYVNSQV